MKKKKKCSFKSSASQVLSNCAKMLMKTFSSTALLKQKYSYLVATSEKLFIKDNSFMLRCVASLRKMSSISGQKLDQVVKQLESLAPISLAEKWDNVGLLIEPARDVKFLSYQN